MNSAAPRRALALLPWLALTSCDSTSPEEALLSFSTYAESPLTLDLIEVTATDGRSSWRYDGADFSSSSQNSTPHTPEVPTATAGTLTVSVAVRDPAGGEATSGTVQIPLLPDWRIGVSFRADTANPADICLGCSGSLAMPLPPSLQTERQDSLYIVWGGNSISDPAIY